MMMSSNYLFVVSQNQWNCVHFNFILITTHKVMRARYKKQMGKMRIRSKQQRWENEHWRAIAVLVWTKVYPWMQQQLKPFPLWITSMTAYLQTPWKLVCTISGFIHCVISPAFSINTHLLPVWGKERHLFWCCRSSF